MKNPGSVILAVLLSLASGPLVAGVLETSIDPPAIDVGESATLRVMIPGGTSDIKPEKYPSVPGLRIEYGGVQQSFRFENGKSWSGAELLFSVTALRPGNYRISSFMFRRGEERLRSAEVSLAVMPTARGGERASAVPDIRSSIELSSPSVFVGQPVILRYYVRLSGTGAKVHRFNEPPATKGFVVKMFDDPLHGGPNATEGDSEKAHVVSFALIPTEAGSHLVGGGSVLVSVPVARRQGGDDFFPGFNFPVFEQARTQELAFDERTITVRALPAGAPADFRGDVGAFTMKAESPPGDIKVYEEKKVTVTVEGDGNLVAMNKPSPVREVPGLKIIAEDGEVAAAIDGGRVRGSRKFIFTLIPEREGAFDTGGFTMVAFNPGKGTYETIRTHGISFHARGGARREQAGFDDERRGTFDLHPVYLALIILTFAGAVVFVVLWERRRLALVEGSAPRADEDEGRSGEEPDYRAELDRCISAGDVEGFLRAADRALGALRRRVAGAADGDDEPVIGHLKEEIYRYKFGRVGMGKDDMKRLRDEIFNLARG